MAIRAKHFEYWVNLGEDGSLSAEGEPVPLGEDVSAEHLLLAGLARCSISSFVYFARLQNLEAKASAHASGTVTRREEDDRYGFTEIECRMDVELDGELDRRGTQDARRERRVGLLRGRVAAAGAQLQVARERQGPVSATALDVEAVRARFTALQRPEAFFDGPAGTQVPDTVIDAISSLLPRVERERRRRVRY